MMDGRVEPTCRQPDGRATGDRVPTILFAQELGGGFGHVTSLVAVARHFPEARRVFVVPHPSLADSVIREWLGPDIPLMGAPRIESPSCSASAPDATMARILERLGFADGAGLAVAVARWNEILDRFDPDLVVADYAPTLRVAAAGRVPHVVMGSGFALPPDERPTPPFRPADAPSVADERAEAEILRAANACRSVLQLAPFPRFTSILGGDATFVRSLPELDPFAGRRCSPVSGPLAVARLPVGEPVVGQPVVGRSGPDIFAYLHASEPATMPILQALRLSGRSSRVFVRGAEPGRLDAVRAPRLDIRASPADLGATLPHVRLVIHPGGQGTAAAALLTGTPQLTLPHSLETELTAERLTALGVGVGLRVRADADPVRLCGLIASVLENDRYGERAISVARGLQARRPFDLERLVVDTCRAFLAAGRTGLAELPRGIA